MRVRSYYITLQCRTLPACIIPLKVSTFMWQTIQNIIPSKDNLSKRGILSIDTFTCEGGCDLIECTSHLFFECPSKFDHLFSIGWGVHSFTQLKYRQF